MDKLTQPRLRRGWDKGVIVETITIPLAALLKLKDTADSLWHLADAYAGGDSENVKFLGEQLEEVNKELKPYL